MAEALGWGAVAASSLVIGALLALAHEWPRRVVGLVLGFGAGALISAVSFELAQEGVEKSGSGAVAIGLAAGAVTYFVLDGIVEHRAAAQPGASGEADAGSALALGAFLDGIPEQLVLGLGLAGGEPVSVGLLAAIFVSNLPEAMGSASGMKASGHSTGAIVRLWLGVAAICTFASAAGFGLADITSATAEGIINGFAAGALLVMLVDSMIPEAVKQAGPRVGLVATLGFAVAAALSGVT